MIDIASSMFEESESGFERDSYFSENLIVESTRAIPVSRMGTWYNDRLSQRALSGLSRFLLEITGTERV